MTSSRNVVILYGGHPHEHEISRKSAFNVLNACFEIGFSPILINTNKIELKSALELIFQPLILNMVHGKWGEDGAAQSLFEELQIPYFGSSVFASEIIFDKAKFRNQMEETVRMPKGAYLTQEEYLKSWSKYPHILKVNDSGSSVDVEYIENKNQTSSWSGKKIVEEFIDGEEGATIVYKGKCLGGVMVNYNGKIFDYNTKYDPKLSKLEDWDKLDQDVRDEISKFSETIYEQCRCKGFLCVDFRISSEGVPYILEANTIPGMTKCSLVPYVFGKHGVSFNEVVRTMVTDVGDR